MPDVFYSTLVNTVLLPLSSKKHDSFKLREVARAALRFMRSADATGGAITMTPWLRHIAPDFFGFTSVYRDNGYIIEFLRVSFMLKKSILIHKIHLFINYRVLSKNIVKLSFQINQEI